MCEKCIRNPKDRNTRYCDDWWEDIHHGGYKGDRLRKEADYERIKKEKERELLEDSNA